MACKSSIGCRMSCGSLPRGSSRFVLAAHSEHSNAAAGEHAEDAYLLAFVGRSPVPAQRDAWTDCRRIAGHVGPHPARLAHVLGNGSVDSVRRVRV